MTELKTINGQIDELYEEFKSNHDDYSTTGNKTAGKRARLAIGELKKLITGYRKASIEFSKQ
jgi:hypothetical protein